MHSDLADTEPDTPAAMTAGQLRELVAAAVAEALQWIHEPSPRGPSDKNRTPQPPKVGYTMREVCAVSGVGRTTLYLAIRRGELRSLTKGRRRIVLHRDLTRWLEGSLPTNP
jgi:excisionase family DNA binding protein